jgi:hypothetical protein
VRIERGQLTANAEFRAAVAHENDVVDHDRRHRDGFAVVDVSHLHLPCEFPGVCVDSDGMRIERIVDDFPSA